MDEQPLVSIMLPAYNHENYIEDCLKSLMAQTYKNIELLVVDDYSLDRTYSILQEWESKLRERFQSVKIKRNSKNQGVVKTLNSMLIDCQGKYIKSIASDDMMLPTAIENLVNYFEQNPLYGIVYSNAVCCGEKETYPLENNKNKKRGYENIPPTGTDLMQTLYEGDFILAPTVLFKADTVKDIGLFDENIGIEDWEYWIRISENYSIGYVDDITVAYRIMGTSLSHFSNDENGRQRLRNMYYSEKSVIEKYENNRKLNAKRGIEKFCNRNLHWAIDLEYDQLIKEIFVYAKGKGVKFNFETKMKYMLYKMHFLKSVQSAKRKLGLETAIEYK